MVIESSQELEYFLTQISTSDIFIYPIYTNQKKHPSNNDISLVYVYTIESSEEFMLVFNHGEKFHDVYSRDIFEKLGSNKIYSFDKKSLLHLHEFQNVFDLNLVYYFDKREPYDFDNLDSTSHTFFRKMYREREDLNCIIPILKHQEVCTKLKNIALDIIFKYPTILSSNVYNNYNEKVITNFYNIEKSGLYYDFKVFNQFFKDKGDFHKSDSRCLYTNYNIFTATGRPSNSYGGINFAALKKDNGERALIKSRHKSVGILVEFDYDAFHIRLISDLVNFQFPYNISVHEYLGEQYFGTKTLTKQEYEDSKNLTFQLLYGGISDEFKEIPFFKVVDEYIYNIWNKVKTDGYIKSKIFGRKIIRTDDNFTRQKLFNYMIQCHETEFNVTVLEELNEVLKMMDSDIVLYTYDSMLFDVPITEGKDLVNTVKEIMEKNDKFPVKIKYGNDYHNMKDLRK